MFQVVHLKNWKKVVPGKFSKSAVRVGEIRKKAINFSRRRPKK